MKKMILLLSGLLFFAFTASAEGLKIGYVDKAKAFAQYDGVKKLTDKMTKEFNAEKAGLEKEAKDIETVKEELIKKSSIMDKKELSKQGESLMAREEVLKRKALELQQKYLLKQREMSANLDDEINVIIMKIAKDKKFDYVFDKSMLLFGGEDITYDVIKVMNGK